MTAKNTVELLKQVSKLMSNGGFDSVLKNVRYQSISITTLKGVNFDKKNSFNFKSTDSNCWWIRWSLFSRIRCTKGIPKSRWRSTWRSENIIFK